MADALKIPSCPPDHAISGEGDSCPCEICRTSSPNRSGPRVLSGLDPIPGESLIGLVARTSRANWLARLRSILASATTTTTSHWHIHFNLAARHDVDFAQLAFACRLAPHEVEQRRYRPDELMPDMPGVGFHSATIPAYDLELRTCRIAPSWLRAGYHCALGHHALATHCPQSGEFLIDACPRCGKGLTWTRSAFHSCHACGLDISRHQGNSVPQRLAAATRPMLDLVHPDPARHAPAVRKLTPLLRDLDRGLVFEIGWRMGCVLTGNGLYDRDTAKRLPVETRLEILRAGSSAIAAWPDSLSDALKGFAPGSELASLEIASAARRLPTFKNAWPALKEALHRAAPGLNGGPLRAVKASLLNGVNSGELQHALGVGQKVVERLRGTQLTAAIAVGERNSHQIFEGAGLERMRSLLGDRIAVGTISERMGISRHGVEQLACLGELEVCDEGAVSIAYVRRQARRSDFERLLLRLEAASSPIDEDDGLPIHHAMRAIGGREKPWGPLIRKMLNGDIPFSLDEGAGKVFERIRILAADLGKVVELRFESADYPDFAFDPTINGRDSEELLNIFPKSTRVARDEGALPVPVDGTHARAVILDLAKKNISVSEVLARWNGMNRRLPAPLRGRRRLPRLSTLGWDRKAVEAAMAHSEVEDTG